MSIPQIMLMKKNQDFSLRLRFLDCWKRPSFGKTALTRAYALLFMFAMAGVPSSFQQMLDFALIRKCGVGEEASRPLRRQDPGNSPAALPLPTFK